MILSYKGKHVHSGLYLMFIPYSITMVNIFIPICLYLIPNCIIGVTMFISVQISYQLFYHKDIHGCSFPRDSLRDKSDTLIKFIFIFRLSTFSRFNFT